METFIKVYERHLKEAVKADPDMYFYPYEAIPEVVQKIKIAIERNSFNKDSPAFKATCKELKIKHTYKAIGEFISSHP